MNDARAWSARRSAPTGGHGNAEVTRPSTPAPYDLPAAIREYTEGVERAREAYSETTTGRCSKGHRLLRRGAVCLPCGAATSARYRAKKAAEA